MSPVRITLAAALSAAQIADIVSTYAVQAAGGHEANPIMIRVMEIFGGRRIWLPPQPRSRNTSSAGRRPNCLLPRPGTRAGAWRADHQGT